MGKSEPPPEQFVSIGQAHAPQPFDARAVEKLIEDLGAGSTARPGTVVSGAVKTPVTAQPKIGRRARWLAGGLAALCLAILVGVLMQHGDREPPAPAVPDAASTMPAHPRLNVALRPSLLPDAVPPAATVEAEAAPKPVHRPPVLAVRPVEPTEAAPAAPVRMASAAPPPVWTAARAEPSFDCKTVRDLAEELVCTDPELARQDRALAVAYRRALEAGVPRGLLRRQQERWTTALDQAAHEDPSAMPQVYAQRIGELNDMVQRDPFER
jgi:uncharacterized protein YecT (DUF1311 family)